MKKRFFGFFLAALMVVSLLPTATLATQSAGLDNFKEARTYVDGTFTDMKTDDWFYEDVTAAYDLRLMVGKGDNFFDAESNMTVAEAMTIAARLHSIYYTGAANFAQEKGNFWASVYTDYCKTNGIADPADYELNKPVTRGQFAEIFAHAFPADALKAVNTVQDNMIPDVKTTDAFGAAIYQLYRAGILTGNDNKGTFAAETCIKRAEVAAIATRMAVPTLRQSIKLVKRSTGGGYTPPTYTVTFNMQGHGEQIEPITGLSYGAAITEPTAPTAVGYDFGGWHKVADDTDPWDFENDKVTANVTLYAKWLAPSPSFKAVYNTADGANTLTFYFDDEAYTGDNIITVYKNLPTAATGAADWGYNGIRSSVKSVVIDSSVGNYTGLTSTAYMFYNMTNATGITGAEYLNTANVTNMSNMFDQYGYNSTELTAVPDVSNWDTAKVTNMSNMFNIYGCKSTALTKAPAVSSWNTASVEDMSNMFAKYGYNSSAPDVVPDVSKWNTANVTNMSKMFYQYGYNSTTLTAVPDVSKWNTDSVTNMSHMFGSYGSNSKVLNAVPDVSKWNTASVTDMSDMFNDYGSSSNALTEAPNVSGWNTANVTNMYSMFCFYGQASNALNAVPDVSEWNTSSVTNMSYMFKDYGEFSANLNAVPDVSNWDTGMVTDMKRMFNNYGNQSTKLTEAPNVSGWNTANVTDMSYMFAFYGYTSTELTAVPDVSNWNTGNVTNMEGMFSSYGYTSTKLNFTLDLSGWNIGSVTVCDTVFEYSGKNASTWSVTIPAKTGDKDNEATKWYVGDGTNIGKYIVPAAKKSFVIATDAVS